MSKVTSYVLMLLLSVACDPHIVKTDESTLPDIHATDDMASHSVPVMDTACPVGTMSCLVHEIALCVPFVCGGCGAIGCNANQPDCCADSCVNLKTYHTDCGVCGNRCAVGYYCADGVCVNK